MKKNEIYDYPLLNEIKARMFDEITEYALDDNCVNEELRSMVVSFNNAVEIVNETGVAQ